MGLFEEKKSRSSIPYFPTKTRRLSSTLATANSFRHNFNVRYRRPPTMIRNWWHATSSLQLERAENNLISQSGVSVKGVLINIGDDQYINTLSLNNDVGENKTPVVLLHGFGMGAATWSYCFKTLLTSKRKILFIDMLGCGRSSRPTFKPKTVEESEVDFFVESLEKWRVNSGLQRMILSGHSFGGYMAVAYAERYPQNVEKLILVSPVGVPIAPSAEEQEERLKDLSFTSKTFVSFFRFLWSKGATPQDMVRFFPGPVSKYLVNNMVAMRYRRTHGLDTETLSEYMYHSAASVGSGEYALPIVLGPGVFAYNPLKNRIPKLEIKKISFIYGERDWMDVDSAFDLRDSHPDKNIEVHIVKDCGHQLMIENPVGFSTNFIQNLE